MVRKKHLETPIIIGKHSTDILSECETSNYSLLQSLYYNMMFHFFEGLKRFSYRCGSTLANVFK